MKQILQQLTALKFKDEKKKHVQLYLMAIMQI